MTTHMYAVHKRPRACRVPPQLKAVCTERGVSQATLLKVMRPHIDAYPQHFRSYKQQHKAKQWYSCHISDHSYLFLSILAMLPIFSIHVEVLLLLLN